MDALSQILTALSVKSYITTGIKAGSTFAIEFPPFDGMKLLAVRSGRLFFKPTGDAKTEDSDWTELDSGKLLLLTRPMSFILTAKPGNAVKSSQETPYTVENGLANYGGDEIVMLGGKMTLDPSASGTFVESLPSSILISNDTPQSSRLHWLMQALHTEILSPQPGSSLMSVHFMQLVLLEIIRTWINSPVASEKPGIFQALKSPPIFRVLSAMHGNPERDWSLESLSSIANMSRAGFAAQFKELLGVPPLKYLTQWRISCACKLLREENLSVKETAARLGFSSSAHFTAVFKRVMGLPPSECKLLQASVISSRLQEFQKNG